MDTQNIEKVLLAVLTVSYCRKDKVGTWYKIDFCYPNLFFLFPRWSWVLKKFIYHFSTVFFGIIHMSNVMVFLNIPVRRTSAFQICRIGQQRCHCELKFHDFIAANISNKETNWYNINICQILHLIISTWYVTSTLTFSVGTAWNL